MDHERWMRLAIERATQGIACGQTPFGAAIVRDGRLLVASHNLVWHSTDVIAHAEIVAIREACRGLGSIDLSGCTIYSTCEPCPMCFSACHWARIARIIYGASIADAEAAGFHELPISNADLKRLGGSTLEIVPGILKAECAALFQQWLSNPSHQTY